jgi:hypothetical protein
LNFSNSTNGNRHHPAGPIFKARLGAARVVVFKDDHAAVDGETIAVWTVYLQPREPDRANDRDRPTPAPAKQATAQAPARPKARPAPAKRPLPDATKRAIDDINNRYASSLNDDIPHDL